MNHGNHRDFRDALLACESGWDRARHAAGDITDGQLDAWAGGQVEAFHSQHDALERPARGAVDAMSYRSMNSLSFIGYQFGAAPPRIDGHVYGLAGVQAEGPSAANLTAAGTTARLSTRRWRNSWRSGWRTSSDATAAPAPTQLRPADAQERCRGGSGRGSVAGYARDRRRAAAARASAPAPSSNADGGSGTGVTSPSGLNLGGLIVAVLRSDTTVQATSRQVPCNERVLPPGPMETNGPGSLSTAEPEAMNVTLSTLLVSAPQVAANAYPGDRSLMMTVDVVPNPTTKSSKSARATGPEATKFAVESVIRPITRSSSDRPTLSQSAVQSASRSNITVLAQAVGADSATALKTIENSCRRIHPVSPVAGGTYRSKVDSGAKFCALLMVGKVRAKRLAIRHTTRRNVAFLLFVDLSVDKSTCGRPPCPAPTIRAERPLAEQNPRSVV